MSLPHKHRGSNADQQRRSNADLKICDQSALQICVGSAGFTLVEILIAIVILATGLVLVLQGMGTTEQALRSSANLVRAGLIAEEQLAESELEIREEHKLSFRTQDGEVRLPGKSFKWEKNADSFTQETVEDETKLNHVRVVVKWQDGAVKKDLELNSLLLNREKQQ